jgi:hypothetical protein
MKPQAMLQHNGAGRPIGVMLKHHLLLNVE